MGLWEHANFFPQTLRRKRANCWGVLDWTIRAFSIS